MRFVTRLLLALLAFVALPATAQAQTTYTLDFKAHWSAFKANSEVDVPLYFVETRGIGSPSTVTPGSMLHSVKADFASAHSRFVSFKPADGIYDDDRLDFLDKPYKYVRTGTNGNKSTLRFFIRAKRLSGLPITLENSGIGGRTEVFIGTVRIAVGPVVEIGGRKVVFDATLYDDPSGGAPIGELFKPDVCYCNLTFMSSKRIMVVNDGSAPEIPEDENPGTGGGDTPPPGGDTPNPGDGGGTPPATTVNPAPNTPTTPTVNAGGTSSAASGCGAAQAALKKANSSVKTAQKLATSRAKAVKRAPAAKRAAARKRAKQAEAALKKAKRTQKTAQGRARSAC